MVRKVAKCPTCKQPTRPARRDEIEQMGRAGTVCDRCQRFYPQLKGKGRANE